MTQEKNLRETWAALKLTLTKVTRAAFAVRPLILSAHRLLLNPEAVVLLGDLRVAPQAREAAVDQAVVAQAAVDQAVPRVVALGDHQVTHRQDLWEGAHLVAAAVLTPHTLGRPIYLRHLHHGALR